VKLIFHERVWEDYQYWLATDRDLLARVSALIKECCRDPFRGIGKPEHLRGSMSGWWSRRMTREHRLVYRRQDDRLLIAQCRHHY